MLPAALQFSQHPGGGALAPLKEGQPSAASAGGPGQPVAACAP